uniref:Uncharacterized protein n=1 Tax=Tanacetum cinerariifolium TaxID=118510 RepID=A0A699H9U6_TANCI|nr:hypothetical protein [Tanacetum cinerariifolium]
MSGPESPPELRRSWYVEGHMRFGVISSKTPSPSLAFIKENIDVLRTMIKEHDQQSKKKATPRRLTYADSDKEAPARQTRSADKSQRTPSKNKEPSHLRMSRRLEDRSRTNEKTRRERSKSRGKRYGHQETSSDSEYEEGLKDTYEDLNSPYKRPKPTPFTQRITRFKYHRRAKLHRNIKRHTRMSVWIISRGDVLLIPLGLGYRVLIDLILHRSSINNSARLSNKFGGFYFIFKFGISGLLHQVITALADRIRGGSSVYYFT